jgi:hypothetical protein
LSCAPYQQLERLRIRIEAEPEERREAGERSHESAVEVLESYAATTARAARSMARICRFYYRDRKRHSEYIS